ncbi:MAG TPA: DUF5666 domain-containing protein [Terracidiphilus sp.]|nr:DUF5666 domain-containing protein [Terracidiphilus sp.]
MDTHKTSPIQHHKVLSVAIVCLALALSISLSACSSGSSGAGSTPTPTPAAKTIIQVNMGDSPADWMLAFSMNITSMSLTGSNGSVSVVSSTVPMEMMHLMGMMQPLSMINAPQGTYTGASITIGSVTVMYMDPTTKLPVQKTISGPMTASVTFSSPMTLGSTPMAMGFDLDLANSVADANGNLTVNPVFHFSSGMQGSGNPADFTNGGIQQMMGSVSNVSGSSFAMSSMQAAQNFTFMTNSSTVFSGTSMSGMAVGMLVIVDATLQSDGSLMATRVQSMMNSGGVMGGGIVTAVTGQPPTSLTMVMQNGQGAGMMASAFAAGVTVNLSGGTTYQIDGDGVDMAGLSFTPTFDANHIYAGQSAMPIGSGGMMSGGMGGMMGGSSMAGTITASEVVLEPQGLSGTIGASVTSGATTSFTLTPASDSAFCTLTGATKVTIFQQPQTTVAGTSPIASGSSVHAFGLLFNDAGQWKMVASRIGTN